MAAITQARAERIARGHPCPKCGEYSFKKLKVKRASAAHQKALGEVWHLTKICGVCGTPDEIGLDGEGEIVYGG